MTSLAHTKPARQTSLLVWFAFAIAAIVVAACVVAPFLGGFSPNTLRLLEARQPPSPSHWLGTDELGRDILARLIHGATGTIVGPVVVATLSALIGVPLALIAVTRGGLIESTIMRVTDLLLALPAILLIIVVVGLLGGSHVLAVLVLTALIVPGDLRIARSAALGQKNLPYLEAARLMGTKEWRVMSVHMLPNLVPTILATFLLDFVGALVALSSLAYLGLGAPPGSPDWGTMLSENLRIMTVNPWAAMAPALLLVLVAYAATTIGDWLYIRVGGAKDE